MRRCSSHWGLALLDTIDRGRGGARATPKGGRASRVKYGVMYVLSLWWILRIEHSHSPLPVEAEVTENTKERGDPPSDGVDATKLPLDVLVAFRATWSIESLLKAQTSLYSSPMA